MEDTRADERLVWWRHGVIYQIYPRSFMDTNGDGIGDLRGVIQRLDYLEELGVDAIWLSPIYRSPMKDFGYDVSNHTDIDPVFGDLETFDLLLAEAHKRHLRVILDYVPNHTSDQHPWFIESRKSNDGPKQDWYLWRDAKPDGSEPNNWVSHFGGKAWEWDDSRQQYYLHLFLKEQPDLNWRNPDVVGAMHGVMRFWFDRGIDGFRVDAVMYSIKHPDFPDNPPLYESSRYAEIGMSQEPVYTMNQPGIHDLIRDFRRICDSYEGDRVMIGETWFFDPSDLVKAYGANLDEFDLPFNFTSALLPWDAEEMRAAIESYYSALPKGALPNFVFGNHDIHRLATRFGHDNIRSAGMLLLTLWGAPTMYYGDEIGMRDVDVPPELTRDVVMPDEDLRRDPERTPMQWDSTPNAGFSPAGAEPWLPVASDYEAVNVEAQQADPASHLSFYRSLLKLRRDTPALHGGSFKFVDGLPTGVLGYTRSATGQHLLVIINFESEPVTLNLAELARSAKVLLSSQLTRHAEVDIGSLAVEPHESLLLELPDSSTPATALAR